MSDWAFVFPGQGAQEIGMGRALAEARAESLAVWEEAESVLGLPLRQMAWEGAAEELSRTDVTQPALLTSEVAALRCVESAGIAPCATAGHSLGEYAALVAAGSLSFADALRVVQARGQAMQSAAEAAGGGMAAVIGADEALLMQLCTEVGGVAPANINAPGQVVVSGTEEGITALIERVKEAGAKRAVRLNVAGAFHSPAMAPAADKVASVLETVDVNEARVPVYTNITACSQTAAQAIQSGLVAQVTGQVLWSATIQRMVADGITRFVEMGPGTVLAGLIRRTFADATVQSVGDPASLDRFLEAVAV